VNSWDKVNINELLERVREIVSAKQPKDKQGPINVSCLLSVDEKKGR